MDTCCGWNGGVKWMEKGPASTDSTSLEVMGSAASDQRSCSGLSLSRI
jgi:hypothetical protein